MSQPSRPKEILHIIFDVIEEIVSLIIAIIILVYTNYIAPSDPNNIVLLLNGVLLVVGLVAISNLRDRLYRFRKIQGAVDKISLDVQERTIYKSTGPDEFFTGRDESYGEYLSSASSIGISGITLSGTIQTHRLTLQRSLEKGSQIKIIILDPESDDALNQLVLRSWSNSATAEYYKGSLKFISELITNIGNTQQAKGTLEIGYLPFVPSLGMTILENEKLQGVAFIELYHHLTDSSPGFFIDESKAPNSFQLYHIQFEKMWKKCKIQKIV